MLYKTIIFELLAAYPALHERLRQHRKLLAVTETLASALKTRHEALKRQLSGTKSNMDPSQASSAAMEIAVTELENRLQAAFPPDGQGELTLEAAMAFVRSLTSNA